MVWHAVIGRAEPYRGAFKGLPALAPTRENGGPGGPKNHKKNDAKTKGSKGSPKSENKRLEPQSDRAGAVQTQFATFHTNSKYH